MGGCADDQDRETAARLRARDPERFDRVAAELAATGATYENLDPLSRAELIVETMANEITGETPDGHDVEAL